MVDPTLESSAALSHVCCSLYVDGDNVHVDVTDNNGDNVIFHMECNDVKAGRNLYSSLVVMLQQIEEITDTE